MMKSEFENLAGREVTDEQYRASRRVTSYMSIAAIYSRAFSRTTVNLCISHRWTNTMTDTRRKIG